LEPELEREREPERLNFSYIDNRARIGYGEIIAAKETK
jgi:hypothetical protein